MTESSSAASPTAHYATPEAFLADLDEFVRRVKDPEQTRPEDAQRLRALLAQAEAYSQSGRFEVAATAYERLLAIMPQFEAAAADAEQTVTEPSQAVSPANEPAPSAAMTEAGAGEHEAKPQGAAQPVNPSPSPAVTPPGATGAPTGRRIVRVERKKIRPYRSPDASGAPPIVEEIQRTPTAAGYRALASIPTASRPGGSRRWLPALVASLILVAVALGTLIYRDALLEMMGLDTARLPTTVASAGRTATLAPAVAIRTPSPVKLPTNNPATHIAPTNTLSSSVSSNTATAVATPPSAVSPSSDGGAPAAATGAADPTATPTLTATPTTVPSATAMPTQTETPVPTDTPTATPSLTPSPWPTMIFTGQDPLAGATSVLFSETFDTPGNNWNLVNTGFSLSQFQEGKLIITLKNRHTVAWLLSALPYRQDFFAMITVTSPNCNGDDDFGLDFRAADDDNQFQFGISCSGRYGVQERENGAVSLVVVPTHSDAIKTGPGAVNELGVRAEGKQISLYVNRQFLTRVDVATKAEGRFGTYASAFDTPNLIAQFDNFTAWSLTTP